MSTADQIFKALQAINKGKTKSTTAGNIVKPPTSLQAAESQQTVDPKALVDSLTGLHNKKWFDEELGRKMVDANRLGTDLWLFVMDFDFFKHLNIEYGQNTGDQVLKLFGELMMKEKYAISRIGGEEFAQIVPETLELEDLQKIVSNLATIFKERSKITLDQVITLSFGTVKMNFGETPANFLNRAEAALFRSKKEGRDKAMLLQGHPKTGSYITIPFTPQKITINSK